MDLVTKDRIDFSVGEITVGRYNYNLIENEDGTFDLDQYGENSGGIGIIPEGVIQDFIIGVFEELSKR